MVKQFDIITVDLNPSRGREKIQFNNQKHAIKLDFPYYESSKKNFLQISY